MRVLVDAQLPKRLATVLSSLNINTRHTLDLPKQNRTPDDEIIRIADREERVVITKDRDFLDNFILEGQPKKLLIVTTGNIGNTELVQLFKSNLERIKSLLQNNSVVEINENEVNALQ